VLDEEQMLAARTVALKPVRARLVQRPQDWAWSSLRAHLDGRDDGLVTVAPLLDRLGSVTDVATAYRRDQTAGTLPNVSPKGELR
jgi:putative transposase